MSRSNQKNEEDRSYPEEGVRGLCISDVAPCESPCYLLRKGWSNWPDADAELKGKDMDVQHANHVKKRQCRKSHIDACTSLIDLFQHYMASDAKQNRPLDLD